jgi:hypothetical protein
MKVLQRSQREPHRQDPHPLRGEGLPRGAPQDLHTTEVDEGEGRVGEGPVPVFSSSNDGVSMYVVVEV